MKKQASENPGFTLRAAIVAVLLSLVLLASSTYIAIKIGALPWPIVFSVIAAGGIIKLLSRGKDVSVHEINVAQAGASIGGLVAAGIAFTVPGILYLNQTQGLDIPWPNPWLLGLLTALAGLLGVLLSVPLKQTFVDREQLPYPAGTAGAELLKLGKTGGKLLAFVVIWGAVAGIFALARDLYFPAGFTFAALTAFGIYLTILPMPLAIGGGYILGPKASFSWLGGAMVGWLLIVPLMVQSGWEFSAARGFIQNLGMGLVLGSGIGFFISYVLPRLREIFRPMFTSLKGFARLYPLISVLGMFAMMIVGVPFYAAVIAVLGVWIMVTVAGRMTGETNIDPLEQFGIFVGLIVAFIYNAAGLKLDIHAAFMIVVFVSVACAIAGDAGHDFKSAAIIGTKFSDIVKVDLITVIFAGIAAPFVLETIRTGFAAELFTPIMPAPQAQLVAGSISGFAYPQAFWGGFALALTSEIINSFLPDRYKNRVLMMPFGIGLFLGMGFALPIAIGAAIRAWIDKNRPALYQSGLLIAAGVMGGEGIAGFSSGAFKTLGIAPGAAANILIVLMTLVMFSALLAYRRQREN